MTVAVETTTETVGVQLHVRRTTVAALSLLAFAALADVTTTMAGLEAGFPEANPVGSAVMTASTPLVSMLTAKVLAGGIASIPLAGTGYRRVRLAAPVGVAAVWILAAAWNLSILVGVPSLA